MVRTAALLALLAALTAVPAGARAGNSGAACLRELDRLGVAYRPARRRGIAIGVEVRGPLGGVTWTGYDRKPLVLDCSLVVSLAQAGRFLADQGVESATYSSAYQRRNIRGTNRPSRHSYGLAIDVHTLAGFEFSWHVADDYEQGLGDEVDCIGAPLTDAGLGLRTLACQLTRSGLFRMVLTPDYDADHWNHFHLEARPWGERP